jgi:MFS family permease
LVLRDRNHTSAAIKGQFRKREAGVQFNPWHGAGALPRGVWPLFAATLVNRCGTMALPFLVLYCTQTLAFTPSEAGLTLMVYGLGALVSGAIAGWLSDRLGALAVSQISLILSGVWITAVPFTRSYGALIGVVFGWAILAEAYRPAGTAYLSEVVPSAQRKIGFALHRLAVNLGMSVGPLVAGLLASRVSYTALFWIDGLTSIVAGIVLAGARLTTHRPAPQRAERSGVENRPPAATSLKRADQPVRSYACADPGLLYFLAATFPVAMVFFQFEGPLPLFMVRDLRLSEAVYGSVFLINTLLIVLFEVRLNVATSQWPAGPLLSLGALLVAIGFGGLAFVGGTLGIAATIVFWTIGEMILMPASAAYVADIAPADRRGTYIGAYHLTFSLAFTVGPWVGTLLFERFGATTVWSVSFCTAMISSLLLYRMSGVQLPHEEDSLVAESADLS